MKNNLYISPKIQVQLADNRRGVFCIEDIKKGELIEEAPLLLPDTNEWEKCDTSLVKRFFPWPELRSDWKEFCDKHGGILPVHATRPVVVLGYGMVYYRTRDYNVDFRVEKKLFTCNFIARCDINKGEELCLFYGSLENDNE